MTGKIAIEEHFVSKEATPYLPPFGMTAAVQQRIDDGLRDVAQHRLPEMDKHGIDVQIVSLTADGVQLEPDRDKAVRIAKLANDL